MHILITNDDGVYAPGLMALVGEVKKIADVIVLAPERNWSMSGHVKTIHQPIQIIETNLSDGTPALSASASPSDCVALALLGAVSQPIDLVVSGINPYANLGHDITYSGTVTAAMEAIIAGVPAIAVSLDGPEISPEEVDFAPAAQVARKVIENLIRNELPHNTLLSVNIPYLPYEEMKGVQITRQGTRIYRDKLVRDQGNDGKAIYMIGGDFPTGIPEKGTDIGALREGLVSITPISLDLTAHQHISQIQEWDWNNF